MTIELGMRLGLYAALSDGPASPPELAARAVIDARYAREWLEQQASAGIITECLELTHVISGHCLFCRCG
jgi:hypothetical protein